MEMPTRQRGLIISVLVHGLAILLLVMLEMSGRVPDKPEGVTVNFGYIDDGTGDMEPVEAEIEQQPVVEQAAPPPAKAPPVREKAEKPASKIVTQDKQDAPVVKKQTREELEAEQRRRDEIAAKRQADLEKARIEAERQRQEQIERERVEAEQKKQEEQQAQRNAIKGRMGKSFGGSTGTGQTQGEGVTGNAGNQGDPLGDAASNNRGTGGGRGSGISYSLEGRSVVGSLAKPDYTVNDYGDVVVQITVNRNGDVIAAVPGVKGSTTMDSRLLEAAKKAAMTAKFNRDPNAAEVQKGTITYKFKLL
jgi:TonB family protein